MCKLWENKKKIFFLSSKLNESKKTESYFNNRQIICFYCYRMIRKIYFKQCQCRLVNYFYNLSRFSSRKINCRRLHKWQSHQVPLLMHSDLFCPFALSSSQHLHLIVPHPSMMMTSVSSTHASYDK